MAQPPPAVIYQPWLFGNLIAWRNRPRLRNKKLSRSDSTLLPFSFYFFYSVHSCKFVVKYLIKKDFRKTAGCNWHTSD